MASGDSAWWNSDWQDPELDDYFFSTVREIREENHKLRSSYLKRNRDTKNYHTFDILKEHKLLTPEEEGLILKRMCDYKEALSKVLFSIDGLSRDAVDKMMGGKRLGRYFREESIVPRKNHRGEYTGVIMMPDDLASINGMLEANLAITESCKRRMSAKGMKASWKEARKNSGRIADAMAETAPMLNYLESLFMLWTDRYHSHLEGLAGRNGYDPWISGLYSDGFCFPELLEEMEGMQEACSELFSNIYTARDLAEECNMRLVVNYARKKRRKGFEMQDLVSEGVIGLTRAIDKFDPDSGNKLSTYATWWIMQFMGRYITNNSRQIRMPVHRDYMFRDMVGFINSYWQNHGRDPTVDEISAALDETPDEVQKMLNHSIEHNLDRERRSDNSHREETYADLLEDESSGSGEGLHFDSGLALKRALMCLPYRQREIIKLRNGIGDGNILTLEEIGRKYGVTRERIRQIEKNAYRKLKKLPISRILGPAYEELLRGEAICDEDEEHIPGGNVSYAGAL